MKNKIIVLLSVLLAFVSLTFVSCESDDTVASKNWDGRWQLNEEVVFPQTKGDLLFAKSNSGTIKIDPNNDRKIIISGDLFGLYSTLSIAASVVSTTASYDQKVGIYRMKGTATLVDEDEITFKFTITNDNNYSESYTRTAIRI